MLTLSVRGYVTQENELRNLNSSGVGDVSWKVAYDEYIYTILNKICNAKTAKKVIKDSTIFNLAYLYVKSNK